MGEAGRLLRQQMKRKDRSILPNPVNAYIVFAGIVRTSGRM